MIRNPPGVYPTDRVQSRHLLTELEPWEAVSGAGVSAGAEKEGHKHQQDCSWGGLCVQEPDRLFGCSSNCGSKPSGKCELEENSCLSC